MARNYMWHKKFTHCKNCESARKKYKAKGYCQSCYPLVLRLEKVEKWDLDSQDTLIGFPNYNYKVDLKTFQKIKNGVIKQLRERLIQLNIFEQREKRDVYGIDIEGGFYRLVERCGIKNPTFFSSEMANIFDHNFSMEQKKIIFGFLNEIEKNIKWKIDWTRVYFDEN